MHLELFPKPTIVKSAKSRVDREDTLVPISLRMLVSAIPQMEKERVRLEEDMSNYNSRKHHIQCPFR